MRDSHRAEAERLLVRAVEEEVRRSGGRVDGNVLLSRARASLDTMAQTAAEEYEAYTKATDEAEAGRLRPSGSATRARAPELPCWWRPSPPSRPWWPTWHSAPAGARPWAQA